MSVEGQASTLELRQQRGRERTTRIWLACASWSLGCLAGGVVVQRHLDVWIVLLGPPALLVMALATPVGVVRALGLGSVGCGIAYVWWVRLPRWSAAVLAGLGAAVAITVILAWRTG